LFDGDLPACTNKAILLGEIEPRLDITHWRQESTAATHGVVDFMSKMRQMPLAQFPYVGAAIDAVIASVSSLCQNVNGEMQILNCESVFASDLCPANLAMEEYNDKQL